MSEEPYHPKSFLRLIGSMARCLDSPGVLIGTMGRRGHMKSELKFFLRYRVSGTSHHSKR
jgi:hypothetical protein